MEDNNWRQRKRDWHRELHVSHPFLYRSGFRARAKGKAGNPGKHRGVSLPTVTWNPSDKDSAVTVDSSGGSTANCTAFRNSGSAGWRDVRATRGIDIATDSGYCEHLIVSGNGFIFIGIAESTHNLAALPGNTAASIGYYQSTGNVYFLGNPTAYGNTYATNDVIGCAIKNGKVWFSKNGVWQNGGDPAAGTNSAPAGLGMSTGIKYPIVGLNSSSPVDKVYSKFKAADFTYSPPSGFLAWGG